MTKTPRVLNFEHFHWLNLKILPKLLSKSKRLVHTHGFPFPFLTQIRDGPKIVLKKGRALWGAWCIPMAIVLILNLTNSYWIWSKTAHANVDIYHILLLGEPFQQGNVPVMSHASKRSTSIFLYDRKVYPLLHYQVNIMWFVFGMEFHFMPSGSSSNRRPSPRMAPSGRKSNPRRSAGHTKTPGDSIRWSQGPSSILLNPCCLMFSFCFRLFFLLFFASSSWWKFLFLTRVFFVLVCLLGTGGWRDLSRGGGSVVGSFFVSHLVSAFSKDSVVFLLPASSAISLCLVLGSEMILHFVFCWCFLYIMFEPPLWSCGDKQVQYTIFNKYVILAII